jgi:hypothetical protein
MTWAFTEKIIHATKRRSHPSAIGKTFTFRPAQSRPDGRREKANTNIKLAKHRRKICAVCYTMVINKLKGQ